MKFRDIVVNIVSGVMPSGRVGYYIKRFSQEAALRRIASLLLMGLFIFQSLVFIFPPKPSQASGANDLIPGGIGSGGSMKSNLINYVSQDNWGAAFFQLMGLNADYIQNHMSVGALSAGDWKYSMGHNSFGGPGCSTRFDQIPEFSGIQPFPGSDTVYVGSPTCRWGAGYTPEGLISDPDFPIYIGGQWWQIGVIGDCGNIVLRPSGPPNVPRCDSVNLSSYKVLVGEPVALIGIASVGSNSPVTLVDMYYAAYAGNSTSVNDPLVPGTSRLESKGIAKAGNNLFVDNSKSFTFNTAGTYKIRLHVYSNQSPEFIFGFPGSSTGGCEKTLIVNSIPRCDSLNLSANSVQVGTPVSMVGIASVESGSSITLVDMYYAAYAGNSTSVNDPLVPGTSRLESKGIAKNSSNRFVDDSGKSFTFNEPGTYKIRLHVYSNQSPEFIFGFPGSSTGGCEKTLTVTPQPVPDALACQNLQLNPVDPSGSTVPVNITMVGEAGGQSGNVYVANYTYKIYRIVNGVEEEIGERVSNYPASAKSLTDNTLPSKTFEFTEAGVYRIKLTLTPTIQVNVSGNATGNCAKEFTLIPRQSFECLKLTGVPDSGDIPLEVTFTAQVQVENAQIQQYIFNFGDNSEPVAIQSNQNSVVTKHTYNAPGTYTASFTFITNIGQANEQNINCRTQITATDTKYTKLVANLTLLTQNNEPTDANNVTARAGDKLRYQIGICNASGKTIEDYVFKDNISDLLYYADLTDAGGGELQTDTGAALLVWSPIDIPTLESGQACVDQNGVPIYQNYKTFKEFVVTIKDPVPTTGTKEADPNGFDCKIDDEFEGNFVSTPINCSPIKIVDNPPLPRTGPGWALAIIGFFVASSVFLFFRNRMLKRELELVSTLTEGMYGDQS